MILARFFCGFATDMARFAVSAANFVFAPSAFLAKRVSFVVLC
jgi:hypothetical protein